MWGWSTSRRLLIIAEGTRGDCQPYIGLALALKEAGFTVKMVTDANNVVLARSCGVDAVGVFPDGEEDMRTSPTVRQAMTTGDTKTLMDFLDECRLKTCAEELKMCSEVMAEFKPDLLLTTLLTGSITKYLSFHWEIPEVCVALQCLVPSAHTCSPLGEPEWVPGWLHAACWLLLFKIVAGGRQTYLTHLTQVMPDMTPYFNSETKELVNMLSPLLKPLVGGSPALYKQQPDWPEATRATFTGSWVVDAARQASVVQTGSDCFGDIAQGKAIIELLNASPQPPVYIGWGSMIVYSPEYMAKFAVEVLQRLGRRGIILGGFAGLTRSMLDGAPELQAYAAKNVLFVRAAPHEVLFPKCGAILHHGGVGTTVAATRSGVPQVITPVMFDQFDSARDVRKWGVGVEMPHLSRCSVDDVVKAIERCFSDTTMIDTARRLGMELKKENGPAVATEMIKKMLAEEIDTGAWRKRFEARKQLLVSSKKAARSPSCFAWLRRLFSKNRFDFMDWVE